MNSSISKIAVRLMLYGALFPMLFSCSQEIVPIERVDRTALDSLETQITVISDDIADAKLAKIDLEAERDSLQRILDELKAPGSTNPDVHYTVQIVDGAQGYINTRTALPDATVTVSQGNSSTEITTDATGLATFPDLESGFVTVTIEIAGYSDVLMIVDLRDSGTDTDGENPDLRYATTQVMVFPTEGTNMYTITGRSYYEQDETNSRAGTTGDPFHPFTNSLLYEVVPQGNGFVVDCIPSIIPNNSQRVGKIINAVYAGLSRSATTDANGDWTLTLPVVLLSDGSNLFSYVGPLNGDTVTGTLVTSTGSFNGLWIPGLFYPNSLGQLTVFPGGNTVLDLYYVQTL